MGVGNSSLSDEIMIHYFTQTIRTRKILSHHPIEAKSRPPTAGANCRSIRSNNCRREQASSARCPSLGSTHRTEPTRTSGLPCNHSAAESAGNGGCMSLASIGALDGGRRVASDGHVDQHETDEEKGHVGPENGEEAAQLGWRHMSAQFQSSARETRWAARLRGAAGPLRGEAVVEEGGSVPQSTGLL